MTSVGNSNVTANTTDIDFDCTLYYSNSNITNNFVDQSVLDRLLQVLCSVQTSIATSGYASSISTTAARNTSPPGDTNSDEGGLSEADTAWIVFGVSLLLVVLLVIVVVGVCIRKRRLVLIV